MRIAANGFEFDVRETGPADGPPVLLLHGFPQTSRSWAAVAERLSAAAGYRCLAPDQRGYSPGARPSGTAAYGMEQIVGDAVGLLDALGIAAVDVVGHDWGANVAWLLASWHPDRVRTLTAVSVPHPRAYGWAMRHDPEQQQKGSYIKLFLVEGKAEEALLADDGRRLRRMFAGGSVPADAIDEYVAVLSAPGALTAALNWYRAAFGGGPRSGPELTSVTVPTTYVWSTADVALARSGAEKCAEYIAADYRFVELAGVSHWIPEHAPEALATAILDRLSTPEAS